MNSDENAQLYEVFFHYAAQRQKIARESNQRFVYYTNAETAINILSKGELWMRNAIVMNDFSEIRYGHDCLASALSNGGRQFLANALEPIFPGLLSEILQELDRHSILHLNQTYLSCFSEHLTEEDSYGRLSMWRAYGGSTGVAIVFRGTALLSESNALKVYTSPVAYWEPTEVAQEITRLARRIDVKAHLVRMDRETVKIFLSNAMRFAILSTKHPGFKEELEWRAIYQPWFERSFRVPSSVETIKGVPQIIQKIPLKDVPEEGLKGAELADALDRVIIGPTQFPTTIFDALVQTLADRGLSKPESRIHVSRIPLRLTN